MPNGTLRVFASIAGQDAPLAGATVNIYDVSGNTVTQFTTDTAGTAPDISLPAPDRSFSLEESNTTVLPYAVYDLYAFAAGWEPVSLEGVQLFDGQTTIARLAFLPAGDALPTQQEPTVIPESALFLGEGGSAPSPAGDCAYANVEGSVFVLQEVVIPRKITVHLGKPAASATNVSVSFQDYIANVASSEVYPTWPEEALRANILAQISLALNRIYTEWYPSRGYSFNITNNPGYDQAYVYNRTVFAVMERLTAELFSTYVRKIGTQNPYYTEYCDGKTVTCTGMKQWGTVDRANEGKDALAILKYYYGSDIQLVTSSNLVSIPESYPGSPLRKGDTGTSVSILQRQLSRIAKDYPSFGKPEINAVFDAATESSVKAFQKQFSLTVDGVVGRATWYKISYIYVSVKDLAELTSEGEELEGTVSDGSWPGTVLRTGSTGSAVERVQYWLLQLSLYSSTIPTVAVDGVYGSGTATAVKAFQKSAGLTQDGIVGQATWDALYAAFVNAQSDVGSVAYPGTALRTGSTGDGVRQVQFWLRIAADNYSSLSPVTVDGKYGSGTAAAVTAFQNRFSLTADGVVGQTTWQKLNEVSIAVTNNLVSTDIAPGQFTATLREGSSGTPVRALQYNLHLLAAYYANQPDVTLDGIFGARTTTAVKTWQSRIGLTVDGIVGRLTWQSIYQNATSLWASGPVAALRTTPLLTETLAVGVAVDDESLIWLKRVLDFLAQWTPEVQEPGDAEQYDETLTASVKSAQRWLGLPQTGVVTEADWNIFAAAAQQLSGATPGSASPEPEGVWPSYTLGADAAGPAVLQVQQWLNLLATVLCTGAFVEESGILDTATEQALESYQISAGLEPLGVVDLATWESLAAAAEAYA